MRLIILVTLVVGIATFSSCTKKDTYSYVAPTNLIPLEILNYWQYLDVATGSSSSKHYVRCIDTLMDQNVKWFKLHDYNSGVEQLLSNKNEQEVLTNNTNHGIYTYYKYEAGIDTFTKLNYQDTIEYHISLGFTSELLNKNDSAVTNQTIIIKNADTVQNFIDVLTPGIGIISHKNYKNGITTFYRNLLDWIAI